MPDITLRIQSLLDQRQAHTDAVARIDETLEQIARLVRSDGQSKVTPSPRRRRGRSGYKMTAEEMVLAFVKERRNPTGREINQHWKAAGRPWTADVTLGKLVKARKLRRIPLEGERGSRYSV